MLKKNTLTLMLAAFFGGAFLLLLSYAFVGIFPFGDKALLTIDLSHQYVDFYSFLRQSFFADKENFIYSLSTALGGDTLGLTAYYLLSPLNVFILIFPESLLLEAVLFITVLKAGLCAAFFAFFINREFPSESRLLKLSFSLMYGLCAFSVVYAMCPMWIDGVILLPLIAAGALDILRGKSPLLFCIGLFIAIISNYYIGFILCIFIFLFYITAAAAFTDTLKELIMKMKRFLVFSALSGLCCAVLLLPVFFSLRDGRMGYDSLILIPYYNFSPADFFSKLFLGYLDTVKTTGNSSGLPNIFSGVLSVLGLPLYYLNRNIKIKERISFGVLLIFLFFSMQINTLNLLWHGLQAPYWYPYRFSFVFSFTALFLSFKGIIRIKELNKERLILSLSLGLIPYIFGAVFAPYIYVLITALFLILYICLFYKKQSIMFICAAVIFEMGLSTFLYTNNIADTYNYAKRESYTGYVDKLRSLLKKTEDDTLYRTEKTVTRSRNDNMSLGINGLSHYSSVFNNNVNAFIKGMGFLQAHFWTKYKGATPLTDSLFGIKYVISDEKNPFYEKIGQENGYSLYKNPYALPLAFFSKGNFESFKLSGNPFLNQMSFLDEITGENSKPFIEEMYEKSELSYTVTTSGSGPLYFYFHGKRTAQCDLYVNGKLIGNYFRDYIYKDNNYNIVYAGNFRRGEKVNISLYPPATVKVNVDRAYFYRLDMKTLAASLEGIKKAEVKKISSSEYEIKANSDRDAFLLTTIPYSSGFSVKINGAKASAVRAAGTFMAFNVKKGETVISVKYYPKGIFSGTLISIISLMFLILFIFKYNRV